MRRSFSMVIGAGLFALVTGNSLALAAADCPADHDKLEKALKASVKPSGGPSNGGLDNNEWAALVTRDGAVCAVAFSGAKPDDQWPGSRAIAAEKANTANAAESQRLRALHRQSLRGRATGRDTVRTDRERAAQSGGSLLRRSDRFRLRVRSVRRQISWRRDRIRRRACSL